MPESSENSLYKLAKASHLSNDQIKVSGIPPERYESIYRLLTLPKHTIYHRINPDVLYWGNSLLRLQALSGFAPLYPGILGEIQANPYIETQEMVNYLGHFAAASGDIDALEWVKTNLPNSLEQVFNNISLAHCAVISGNPKACEWVAKHVPLAFLHVNDDRSCEKDVFGSVIDYTIRLENPELFNLVLSFSPTPHCVTIDSKLLPLCLTTKIISKALDLNFTLTHINSIDRRASFPWQEKVEHEFDVETQKKLVSNRKIVNAFEIVEACERVNEISEKALYAKFQNEIPKDIPAEVSQRLFQNRRKNFEPILKLIANELQRLQSYSSVGDSTLGFVPFNDDKMKALYALRSIFIDSLVDGCSLSVKFDIWEAEYRTVIDRDENTMSLLYSSIWQQAKTPTRILVTHLHELIHPCEEASLDLT